jgi:hypothetical protein
VEVPFVAAEWALVQWARPSGRCRAALFTSVITAHTVMKRGPHSLQMPQFLSPGIVPDAACRQSRLLESAATAED